MRKKILAATCIAVIIFAMMYQARSQVTLTIGIFAGSNWNVPQGETYAIINEVRKNFEAENPGVRVKYVSGIKKEDYSEWLAEKFIAGSEPDVFFVLAEDFNLYASIGALMNLENLIAADESFSSDVYYTSALNFGKYENISYALPCESNLTFMFVNKTLLCRKIIGRGKISWKFAAKLRATQTATVLSTNLVATITLGNKQQFLTE